MCANEENAGLLEDCLVACDTCGSARITKVATKRGCQIRLCLDCGLLFVSPQPSDVDLDKMYSLSSGYFATAQTDLSRTSTRRAEWLNNLLQSLNIQQGRFLDVGCATGHLMHHMEALGWTATGNDLNDGAIEVARINGLDVYKGSLEECNFESNHFDAVHLGDLIEHVRSPRTLMTEVFRILRPGGVVTIITPNAACSFAKSTLTLSKLTGFPWAHSQAPYHLFDFTPATIRRLLNDLGLAVETINFREGTSFPYMIGSLGYFDKLKQKLKYSGKYRLSPAIIAHIPKLIFASILLLPAFLYGRIKDRLSSSGSNMIVAARKPVDYQ